MKALYKRIAASENALKKAEEKTKQKDGYKILKQDALIKAKEKRLAASIKAQ